MLRIGAKVMCTLNLLTSVGGIEFNVDHDVIGIVKKISPTKLMVDFSQSKEAHDDYIAGSELTLPMIVDKNNCLETKKIEVEI